MLKIVICGYREWALKIISHLSKKPSLEIIKVIKTEYEFNEFKTEIKCYDKIDFILFLGWSWIVEEEIVNKYLCLGLHPSDLPEYRGGSPLQNQIINGVINSKVSLITLSAKKIDSGEIWDKEDLDLTGDCIEIIFNNLIKSSITLLERFLTEYPQSKPVPQSGKGSHFRRRNPEESKLQVDIFKKMSVEEIYNHIRALTSPYPNAFIEDEKGNRLYFEKVRYVKSESENNVK